MTIFGARKRRLSSFLSFEVISKRIAAFLAPPTESTSCYRAQNTACTSSATLTRTIRFPCGKRLSTCSVPKTYLARAWNFNAVDILTRRSRSRNRTILSSSLRRADAVCHVIRDFTVVIRVLEDVILAFFTIPLNALSRAPGHKKAAATLALEHVAMCAQTDATSSEIISTLLFHVATGSLRQSVGKPKTPPLFGVEFSSDELCRAAVMKSTFSVM